MEILGDFFSSSFLGAWSSFDVSGRSSRELEGEVLSRAPAIVGRFSCPFFRSILTKRDASRRGRCNTGDSLGANDGVFQRPKRNELRKSVTTTKQVLLLTRTLYFAKIYHRRRTFLGEVFFLTIPAGFFRWLNVAVDSNGRVSTVKASRSRERGTIECSPR